MAELDRGLRFHRLPPFVVGEADPGVPRGECAHPISPSGVLSDAVLYEDPAVPTTLAYLPLFRVRTTATAYDVKVAATEAGRWAVRIGIEPYPHPDLGDAARTADPISHAVEGASLHYLTPLARSVAASEIIPDGGGYIIGFDLDLPGKDEVLWAFRSTDGATLAVTRAFTAAVPIDAQSVHRQTFQVVDGGLTVAAVLPQPGGFVPEPIFHVIPVEPGIPQPGPPPELVTQPDAVQPDVVLEAAAQPGLSQIIAQPIAVEAVVAQPVLAEQLVAQPLLLQAFAAQPIAAASVDAPSASFARVAGVGGALRAQPFPAGGGAERQLRRHVGLGRLRPEFIDRVLDPDLVVVAGDPPPPTPETRYRYVDTAIDSTMVLRIDPDVHPEVFGGGDAGPAPTYTRVTQRFPADDPNGRVHVYLQDDRRPHVFLHLPDEFRLARTQTPPFRPAVVFWVEQGEGEGEASVALMCELRPYSDPDRLEDALQRLAARVPPAPAGDEAPEVSLEPVQAEAELSLGIPVGAMLVAPEIDLANGFLTRVQFAYAAFQDVFAALAAGDAVSTVLRGTVAVAAGGPSADLVPVDIRFASTVGELLTTAETPADGRTMSVTVTNSSESPVRIDALPVALARGDAVVAATVDGLELPLELIAGAGATFTVAPSGEMQIDGDTEVIVDPSQVVPLPDPTAILALTLDKRVRQLSARTVTVITTAAKLAAGGNQVETVIVEIDGVEGDPPQVDATSMKAAVRVPVPLADVLLRRDDGGAYRFRQIVVRTSGETQQDTDWRPSTSSVLVVPVA